jgi:hypothetical protein
MRCDGELLGPGITIFDSRITNTPLLKREFDLFFFFHRNEIVSRNDTEGKTAKDRTGQSSLILTQATRL